MQYVIYRHDGPLSVETIEALLSAAGARRINDEDWVLGSAEIQLHRDGALLSITDTYISQEVARLAFRVMADQLAVYQLTDFARCLATASLALPSDPSYRRSKVVESWQDVQAISNFDDPEGFWVGE